MPRPKGSKNKSKPSEEVVAIPEEVLQEDTQDESEQPADANYLVMGNFRIYKADPSNLVIEEIKMAPVYAKIEDGKKGKGKPTGEVKEKWVRAGYVSSLEFAFKFLLTRVGFSDKTVIQDYMSELAEIRKLIEQNMRKTL